MRFVQYVCLRTISHLQGIELRFEELIHSVRELKTEVEVLKRSNASNASHIFNTGHSGIEDRFRSNKLHDRVNSDPVDINVEGDFVRTFDNTIQPRHMTEAACSDFSSLVLRQFLSRNSTPPSLQYLNHFDSVKIHRRVVTFSNQRLPPVEEARRLVKAVLAFMCVPKPTYPISVTTNAKN